MADAHHRGPVDRFFTMVRDLRSTSWRARVEDCDLSDLVEAPVQLWQQHRLRMPELVSCQAIDRGALRRQCLGGWLIGIVTNGMTGERMSRRFWARAERT